MLLENTFGKTQLIVLLLYYRFFTWQVIGNAVKPKPMQIFIGFEDAILRCKILGSRLAILTQSLIANRLFLSFIYFRQVPSIQKKKYINLGNQFYYKKYNERNPNITKKFVFIFHHSIQHEASGYTFYKEKKYLLGNMFGSPHTSYRIYLKRNFFSNYVYLKNMYITLKGIGKILFVSVLRMLLICKFLKCTTTFTKKLNFPKFAFNFPCQKVNFSLKHRPHITIHRF